MVSIALLLPMLASARCLLPGHQPGGKGIPSVVFPCSASDLARMAMDTLEAEQAACDRAADAIGAAGQCAPSCDCRRVEEERWSLGQMEREMSQLARAEQRLTSGWPDTKQAFVASCILEMGSMRGAIRRAADCSRNMGRVVKDLIKDALPWYALAEELATLPKEQACYDNPLVWHLCNVRDKYMSRWEALMCAARVTGATLDRECGHLAEELRESALHDIRLRRATLEEKYPEYRRYLADYLRERQCDCPSAGGDGRGAGL